ncbi:uncharacterized protein DUF397 [Actinomadura pelletieri DSM 43383]|uniref:Uncharacterized protein DUF397 n=2 Tax=Actinomadura pelletieri TaxID=111805 RepID=A0A495QXP5_9ACTN|nr:uncharacterized protein DUF397 [Actinomadura pelletieri DSM 43383]
MPTFKLDRSVFRKSRHSEGANGCVETCVRDSRHLIRDSKDPQGDVLVLEQAVWAAMLTQIKQGAYDL